MRRAMRFAVLMSLLLWAMTAAAQEYYTQMPPYLQMTQETVSRETADKRIVRCTYPKTANVQVDGEIRALVDAMAAQGEELLPAQRPDSTWYLDVGPVITRTGTSWMSFLTIAEMTGDRQMHSVAFDARVYDMETGERIRMTDLFAPDSAAWALMEEEVRAQLGAAFPLEEADRQALDALCSREALEEASFTLGGGRMLLTYRADSVYPGKNTLLHVELYYSSIRPLMTPRAQEQTDNSRYRMIALTYDDGCARGNTRSVLDVLRRWGAPATFFIVGRTIPNNHDILSRQQNGGYELESHTYAHEYPDEVTPAQMFENKDLLALTMSSVVGVEPAMMRAPGGMERKYILQGIGYPLMHWSVASGDSGSTNAKRCAARVTETAKDGDIVLMHDSNPLCGQYSEIVLEKLTAQGFMFVTVEELFDDWGVPLEPNRVYFSPGRVESGLD